MAHHLIVYKCADRAYDFSFEPNLSAPRGFQKSQLWLSHDGRARGRGWQPRQVATQGRAAAGKDFNRYCKFLPYEVLPDCDLSIYVDGNIEIMPHATAEIEAFIASDADIGLMMHYDGRTLREEVAACRLAGKLSEEEEALAWARLDAYQAEGFSPDTDVFYGAVLLRRHGRQNLEAAMRHWAAEYEGGLTRDQISLPYVLWRHGVSVHRMTCDGADPAGPFFAHRHKQGRWLSDLNEWRKLRKKTRGPGD